LSNLVNKILRENASEIYKIFEEAEFDPFGHIIDSAKESDDPEELDINLEEDCVLGFSNGNSKLEWPYISLPAGYTCPFATVCKNFPAKWEGPIKGGKFKRPSSWEKNVKPGPEAKFMCYAARAQGQYPAANVQVFKNLNLLKSMKTKEKMANLIIKSMEYHGIDNTDIFRIHEAGDFFNQEYFDAWIEVAKKMPQTLFYAYTVSLPFWLSRRNEIPKNFKLIASMDENNEQTILDNNLRYSKVVNDENEAKELGLPIDVDDMVAWGTDDNFALPLHGPQPKGSEAAQALKRNKQSGLYDKIKQAKQTNQAKKNTLRDKLRRELRSESFIKENDWDWAESISNPLEISDVPQKIWMLDLTREEQKKIYDYLISLGFEGNTTIKAITKSDKYLQKLAVLILNVDNRIYVGDEEIVALSRGEEKPRPKGKLGHLSFYSGGKESQRKQHLEQLKDSWENSYGGYLEIDPKDLLDLVDNNLSEDIKYMADNDGLDWIMDTEPSDFGYGVYDSLKDAVISQLGDYDNISIEDTVVFEGDNFTVYRVEIQSGREIVTLKNNRTNKNFQIVLHNPIPPEWEKELPPLDEDLEYWGVRGDKMGPIKEDDEVTSLKGHRDYDNWVFIHRNLHRPPYYSIKAGRSGGPVIGYDTDIWLEDVTFKVQAGGRDRTRKEMRKNVHAGVVGKIKDSGGSYDTSGWVLVTYNPYQHDSFVEYETGIPIHNAKEAILKNEKEVWIKQDKNNINEEFSWLLTAGAIFSLYKFFKGALKSRNNSNPEDEKIRRKLWNLNIYIRDFLKDGGKLKYEENPWFHVFEIGEVTIKINKENNTMFWTNLVPGKFLKYKPGKRTEFTDIGWDEHEFTESIQMSQEEIDELVSAIKEDLKEDLKENKSDFDWVDDRPQPSTGEIELKVYLKPHWYEGRNEYMLLEWMISFENMEQFLSDVKDYVIEAVEGYDIPLMNIGINGWGALNRYPSETKELKDGIAKIVKMAKKL